MIGATVAAAAALVLCMCAQALASGITNASEDLRTGWYPGESAITPGVVSGGTFGQEWSANVEGQVYAQPLLDENTLLVATEHNRVYGLNPANGEQQWSTTLNGAPWQSGEIGCGDLSPEVGVTATPVIDPATDVAYMTHKAYGEGGSVHWFMDALELAHGGKERSGFPVELAGTAQNHPSTTFNAKYQLQRPGLLLMGGVVYAAFGSDCDLGNYQGWIFGVTESGTVKARWTSETAGAGSGIWQSGSGLASDGPGTILFSTGNGATPLPPTPGSEPPGTLGQSIVRVRVQGNGELKATDFFAPYDAAQLAEFDADFASGGITGLPNAYFGTGSVPHLGVAVGKDGYVYLLNRDDLGGIGEGPGEGDKVVQRIGPNGGVWSRPGVWPGEGGWVYIPTASNGHSAGGSAGKLDVYKYGLSGGGSPTLTLMGESTDPFGFGSGAPVITSSGTSAGSALVWTEWMPNGGGGGAQLRAYDPVPISGHPVLRGSWPIGTASKFATPGIGDGRLYVGTRDGHVLAFGSPVTQPLSGPNVEFPATTLGSHSEETLTITANEEVEIASFESSKPSEFTLGTPSRPKPWRLKGGEKISVPITFSPAATGPRGATLTATLSDARKVQFSLTGQGQTATAQLEGSPPLISFGGTAVGGSVSSVASFTNVGAGPLWVEEAVPPAAPFHVEASDLPPQGTMIGPHEQVAIPVNFEPAATGSYGSAITLKTTAGTASVGLSGSAAPPGVLQVTPEAVPFGGVPVGRETARSFSVSNVGGVAITVYKSKPPSGGEFTATTALPEDTTIAAGETLTETVKFDPTVLGPATGTWLINGEGSSSVHEVLFTGSGETLPAGLTPPLGGNSTLGFRAGPLGAVLAGYWLRASRSWTIPVRVRCPAQSGSCKGTVTLRTRHRVRVHPLERTAKVVTLATGPFTVAGGHTAIVTIRLGPSGRALLERDRTMHADVVIVSRDGSGRRDSVHALATLRAPLASRGH